VDAAAVARRLGSPVIATLVLLGAAVAGDLLCVGRDEIEATIRALSPPRVLAGNLEGFHQGLLLLEG
jgi:hypothetical protein